MKNFPQPHVEVEGKGYGGGGALSPSNSSGQKNTNPDSDNHQQGLHLGSCPTSQQILNNNERVFLGF